MFSNVGFVEIVVILMAGLFILGPDRLPAAAAWVGKAIRQVRDYATGARQQLKDELGPEFDELRKPLAELQQLRGMNPRAALTKQFFDLDTDGAAPARDTAPARSAASTQPAAAPKPKSFDPVSLAKPLGEGERPPYDIDAT